MTQHKQGDVLAGPSKGGQPRKLHPDTKTLEQITELAEIACVMREAAGVLRVSTRTFESFLAEFPEAREAWDSGHENAKASVRRKLYKLADTSAAAAIFLAKNLLGMKDVSTIATELPLANLTDEQINALAAALGAPADLGQGDGGDRAAPTAH
jgi:hypothetical protein